MTVRETIEVFLESRKRGIAGAKKKCTARTVGVYAWRLKVFEDYLLSLPDPILSYGAISRLTILRFLDWLDAKVAAEEWGKATRIEMLRSMRTFFRWVDTDEDCQADDMKGWQKYLPAIEKCPRRQDIPQLNVIKEFKNAFKTDNQVGFRNYVATSLMLDTGMRIGELCNLRLDHVRLDEQVIILDGKSGPRPVAMSKEMVRLYKAWLKKRALSRTAKDSEFVFVSKYDDRMTPNGFAQGFRRHRVLNELPRVSAHALRHSFATNYLKKGGDMERLRMQMGHSTYEMLKEYLHLATLGQKTMQDEIERVSILKEG